MALLHLLVTIGPDLEVHAAHFDHCLRDESASDAESVASWSAGLGVDCSIGRPVDRLAGGGQAEFRAHRYAWLRSEIERLGAGRLTTGHQADDQAETVLMRVFRGTGLRGLGGIPLQRGAIVRPLLHCTRAQVLEYTARHRVPSLTDPSNADPKWTRSRMRVAVLPGLEHSIGTSIRSRLVALAEASRVAEDALERRAGQLNAACDLASGSGTGAARLDREILSEAPAALQARALRHRAAAHGVSLTRGGTQAAVRFVRRAPSGATMDLGGGLTLSREYGAVLMARRLDPGPDRRVVISGVATGEARLVLGGRPFDVHWSGGDAPSKPGHCIALPAGWRHYPLSIRGRQPGDRIRLSGGTRSLKRLYSDRRIPLSERPAVPVLEDGHGRVLWIAGVATDERLRCAEETDDRVVIAINEV